MSEPIRLEVQFMAPLPVGHAVEVLWPLINVGLMSPKWEIMDTSCLIIDRDTGVQIGASTALLALDNGGQVGQRLSGRVVTCRVHVSNVGSGSSCYYRTELWIAPDEAG